MSGWDFVNGGGDIFRTEDGGQTWQREGANTFTDPASFPDYIYFFNANDDLIFGDPVNGSFEIYTTNDGGDHWNQVSSDKIPEPLPNEYGLAFANDAYGKTVWMTTIIFNEDGSITTGRLIRSDNKGKSWYVINSNITVIGGEISIHFRDLSNGLYKSNGVLHRTTDGGATWNEVDYTGTFFTYDFDNVPGVPGCWVSTGGEPNFPPWSMHGIGSSVSYDDGDSWTTLDTGVNHTAIVMVNKHGGFSGGISSDGTGGVFVYTGAPFRVAANNVADACGAIEMNIYPNPSNESFSLAVNAKSDQPGLIRVYNMQGILVMSEKFNPTEVLFFGKDLSPGLYLTEVFIGNEKQVMRLLKQ